MIAGMRLALISPCTSHGPASVAAVNIAVVRWVTMYQRLLCHTGAGLYTRNGLAECGVAAQLLQTYAV